MSRLPRFALPAAALLALGYLAAMVVIGGVPESRQLVRFVAKGVVTQPPGAVSRVRLGGGDRMVDLCARFRSKGLAVVPIGLEISRALAARAEHAFAPHGGRVLQASAVDGAANLEPQSLDLSGRPMEKELDLQPLELLRRLQPTLRPSGVVVLKVPNYDCWNRSIRGGKWCGFRYPDHVNYFTPATLARLADEAGYELLPPAFGDRLPLSDNMYAALAPRAAR